MNRPSLKKWVAAHVAQSTVTDDSCNFRVNFITALGIITCTLFYEEDFNTSQKAHVLKYYAEEQTNDYREQFIHSDSNLNDDDGLLLVKDATIITSNKMMDVGEMIIFYDQIIGITFGGKKK